MVTNKELQFANDRQSFHDFANLIKEFEKSLPPNMLVGAIADGVFFRLEKISLTKNGYLLYSGHSLDDLPFRHIRPQESRLLSLIALPRPEEETGIPKNPIGFETP